MWCQLWHPLSHVFGRLRLQTLLWLDIYLFIPFRGPSQWSDPKQPVPSTGVTNENFKLTIHNYDLLYLLAAIRVEIHLWGYELAPCAQFIICVMTGMHFWKASHAQISRVRRILTSFWSEIVVLTVDTWSLLVDDYYTPNTATHAVYTSEPQSFGLDIYIGFSYSVSSKLFVTVELSLLCIGLQISWNSRKTPSGCALILSSSRAEHTYHKIWDRCNGVAARQDLAPSWSAPTSICCGEWPLLHPILARL